MKIGFIGAGKMGLPVCKRLKAAGHDVTVLARTPERAGEFAKLGLSTASSVADTIKGADAVFTSVSDDQALADVVFSNPLECPVFIDLSTVSPAISERIAAHLPRAVGYLRSPVSGSTALAEAGTLTALVSGPKATLDAMGQVYSCFTKKAFHLGEAEEARYLKLSINSIVAAMAQLTGEALAFGLKGGLTHEAMLEVMNQSAIASPLLAYKTNMIISGDYAAAGALDMLKKDLELLLASAGSGAASMPMNTLLKSIYDKASAKGLGGKDFFVLVQEAEHGSP